MKTELFCPKVGHGNPWAAIAAAWDLGISPTFIQNLTTEILAQGHKNMTQSPRLAAAYTKNETGIRSFVSDIVNGSLSREISDADRRIYVQELLVRKREKYAPEGEYLIIPDVYGKRENVHALLAGTPVRPIVWNNKALAEYGKENALLVAPNLLNPYNPEKIAKRQGMRAVFKSSGSGIPIVWYDDICAQFAKSNVRHATHCANNEPVETQIEKYTHDIGKDTLIVTYPSEQIEIAYQLRSLDVPVLLLMLPPRGKHEQENAKEAVSDGLGYNLYFDKNQIPQEAPLHIHDLAAFIQSEHKIIEHDYGLGTATLSQALLGVGE